MCLNMFMVVIAMEVGSQLVWLLEQLVVLWTSNTEMSVASLRFSFSFIFMALRARCERVKVKELG